MINSTVVIVRPFVIPRITIWEIIHRKIQRVVVAVLFLLLRNMHCPLLNPLSQWSIPPVFSRPGKRVELSRIVVYWKEYKVHRNAGDQLVPPPHSSVPLSSCRLGDLTTNNDCGNSSTCIYHAEIYHRSGSNNRSRHRSFVASKGDRRQFL